MENAAQALLIAGGILITIVILSMVVVMFNNLKTIGNAQADKKEVESIAKWNAEWEAYNKNILYGADVLTIVNKANNNNINGDYIEIIIDGVDKKGNTITNENISNYKTEIFECTEVEYNKNSGKISKMAFKLKND